MTVKIDSTSKRIYLTFDDGPTPQWTPRVLEVLKRHQAKATFFVLGRQAQRRPDLVRAEASAGHCVGNHTFNHVSLAGIEKESYVREVRDTQAAIGEWESKFLRPPYGDMDDFTRAYAQELGYELVLWDIDPKDWSRPGVTAIVDTVVGEARPGAIVLFHDGGGDRSQTVNALEIILETLGEQGYQFDPLTR